jgi:DNA repair protein RadC
VPKGNSVYRLDIVRRRIAGSGPPAVVRRSADIYRLFRQHFAEADREHCYVALLDHQNRLIGFNLVAIGSVEATAVKPREILKAVVLGNASACIVLHNHPGGDATPSADDIAFTRRLTELMECLGVPLLDHIIFGDDSYSSLADMRLV